VSNLACHVDDYLRLRRALGFKLEWPGHLLPQLLAYHDAAGASTLTADLIMPGAAAEGRAATPLGASPGSGPRLRDVLEDDRPSHQCRHLHATLGAHQPPAALWSDTDVCRLLEAYRRLQPALQAATHEAVLDS
jgi:hypothetical protein